MFVWGLGSPGVPGQKRPKCDMGFDSDTFSPKTVQNSRNIKVGQNEVKNKWCSGRT